MRSFLLASLLLVVLMVSRLPLYAQEPQPIPTVTEPLAMLGRGVVWDVEWSPQGRFLAVNTTSGLYVFDQTQPDTAPQVIEGQIINFEFSPDETRLLVAMDVQMVRVYDTATLEALVTLESEARVGVVSFEGEAGEYIQARVGEQSPRAIRIWHSETLEEVTALVDEFVWTSVFTPEGIWVMTDEGVGLVRNGIFDQRLTPENALRPISTTVSYSSDMRWLTMIQDEETYLYNLVNGTAERLAQQPTTARFSADDRFLTLVSFDDPATDRRFMTLLNLETNTAREIQVDANFYSSFSPDGRIFAYASGGDIRLIDLATGEDGPVLEDAWVNGVYYQLLDQYLYTFDTEDTGVIWDVTTGEVVQRFENIPTGLFHQKEWFIIRRTDEALIYNPVTDRTANIPTPERLFSFSFYGDQIAYVEANEVRLRDLNDDEEPITLAMPGHTSAITDLALTPDGQTLFSTAADQPLRWHISTGKATPLTGFEGEIKSVAVSGAYVVGAGSSGQVYVWSSANGGLLGQVSGHVAPVWQVTFNPFGTQLASADESGVIYVWDFPTIAARLVPDTPVAAAEVNPIRLENAGAQYRSLAFSPDNRTVVGGGIIPVEPGASRFTSGFDVWDLATQTLTSVQTQGFGVTGLSFSPDGRVLASTGGVVEFWSTETYALLNFIPDYAVYEALYTSTGTRLIGMPESYSDFGRAWATYIFNPDDGRIVAQVDRQIADFGRYEGGGGASWLQPRPVALTPDGLRFASAEAGHSILLWGIPQVEPMISTYNILAYCDKSPQDVPVGLTARDTVSIFWSWYVTEPQYMDQHLQDVEYEITLDGTPITNWQDYGGQVFRDPANENYWTMYWSIPVGTLSIGPHQISYRATWREQITDGLDTYGPGGTYVEDTGTCNFNVVP